MKKSIIILLFFLSGSLYAVKPDSLQVQCDIWQELQRPGNNNGSAKVEGNPAINNMLRYHIQSNKKNKSFPGYRIQIYSASAYNSDIEKLKQIKNDFEKEFLDIPAYLKYFDPDFKIRVGNFRSRLECMPALQRIKKRYPASYPVKTDITAEELKRGHSQEISTTETEVQ